MDEEVDALLEIRAEAPPGVDTRVMRAKLEARLFERVDNPVRIGGFDIVERIGDGGMGTVWLAHDPRLDRRVAVKLLHAAAATPDGLLREARALARLAHPHVVTVFESGMFEADVFVAMEYLDGGSLADWIAAHRVTTRRDALRTIELFIAAGRGLAAAHDAGLVHRDFKPANVLLGADGRLKVADFGLARAIAPHAAVATTERDAAPRRDRTTADDGSNRGGTPAYMAPEQFEGRADASSDQFSFCVALWEALHGTRPFVGASLSLHLRDPGFRLVPPRTSRAPSWAIRALLRGLAFDPQQRWPSMHALVAALDAVPRTARRRRAWAIAGALAITAVIAWRPWDVAADPCARQDDELATAWGDETRTQLEQAFAAVGTELATETWTRIDPLLSDYAERWLATREAACEASVVRHERSTEAYQATIACLDRRRDALATTTSLLAAADTSAIDRAVEAVQALAPPEECEDPPQHDADPPEVVELRRGLDEADAALHLGAVERSRTTLADVAPRIDTLGRADLTASLRYLQSRIAHQEFDPEATEARALEALHEAARAGDDRLAADLWRHLVYTIAVVRGEPRRALTLELAATAATVRAGDDPLARADLHLCLGSAHVEAEAFAAAEAELDEALGIFRARVDADSPQLGSALSALGTVRGRLKRYDDALALQQEALRIFEVSLGSHHPKTAVERAHVGASLSEVGRHAEAIEVLRHAIADLEATHGDDHDEIARALSVLGPTLAREDRMDEGIAALERGVAMCELLETTNPSTYLHVLGNLGAVLDWAGRTQEAIAVAEKGIAAIERSAEPDHEMLAANVANLASMRAKLGELEPARAGFERAVAIIERTLGTNHPSLAHSLLMLSRIATAQGDPDRALALAERAAALSGNWAPSYEAEMKFELARCRWEAGLRDAHTHELAAAAEALAREDGSDHKIEKIVTWRASHPIAN